MKRASKKIKVAVLGASGLVGQHFVRMLGDHPFFEVGALTSSEQNAGKKYGEVSIWEVGRDIPEEVAELSLKGNSLRTVLEAGADVIFCALPARVAGPVENELRNSGLAIFTNSSAHRMDEDVPVIIPEVNHDHIQLVRRQRQTSAGFIIAGSNCCVSGLALSLKPLLPWEIRNVRVTTFQSISGAGRGGLSGLDISGNLIPYIKEEEEKIARETPKILGNLSEGRILRASFQVRASSVRVPVREGHLLDVAVELSNQPELEEVISAFRSFRGLRQNFFLPTAPEKPIILRKEPDRPQPCLDLWAGLPERARGMAVSVGRIRLEKNFLRFFVLVHNLIRGAAGNCVLNAELALSCGVLDGGKK